MSFRHVREWAIGKPRRPLSNNTTSAKTCTMAYQTLFSGFGIYIGGGHLDHAAQFMKGTFILILHLTLDGCASDGHSSIPDIGKTEFELKFDEALADAVTTLYLKVDGSLRLDSETLQPISETWTRSRTMHSATCLRSRGSSRLISCPLVYSLDS